MSDGALGLFVENKRSIFEEAHPGIGHQQLSGRGLAEGAGPVRCRFCSQAFPFRSYLLRHERKHTGSVLMVPATWEDVMRDVKPVLPTRNDLAMSDSSPVEPAPAESPAAPAHCVPATLEPVTECLAHPTCHVPVPVTLKPVLEKLVPTCHGLAVSVPATLEPAIERLVATNPGLAASALATSEPAPDKKFPSGPAECRQVATRSKTGAVQRRGRPPAIPPIEGYTIPRILSRAKSAQQAAANCWSQQPPQPGPSQQPQSSEQRRVVEGPPIDVMQVPGLSNGAKKRRREDQRSSFVCPHCDRHFRTKQSLDGHVQYVHFPRPHACPLCPERFLTVRERECHLEQHANAHRREQPLVCQLCNKRFDRVKYLVSHVANEHAPSTEGRLPLGRARGPRLYTVPGDSEVP
ncbi:uncharacterized protein LOC144158681 [Haemaphysalis longicornis]